MRYYLLAALSASFLVLQGCSPTLNWRDVRTDQTPLIALFPCKPDQVVRTVSLGAKDVAMTMLGCDAGDATFSLAHADMRDAANPGAALDQWKRTTLGNMRVGSASELPFPIKGASVSPQPVRVEVRGVRPDGTAVAMHAVWFASGTQVFQAAVHADSVSPAVAESFFAGLRLQ
jgi:hypothetical protein